MGPRLLKPASAALAAFALAAGIGQASAAYKLQLGWSPQPHFPAPLVKVSPAPNTWVFETRLRPELELRRHNWELRVTWEREDREEWNFPRIFRQMLRLGCEIVDPSRGPQLIEQLYTTRSLVPPRDLGERGVAILHRLTVVDSGCVITLEARGARSHTLKIVVSPARRQPIQ
jgi:hypothetical protein